MSDETVKRYEYDADNEHMTPELFGTVTLVLASDYDRALRDNAKMREEIERLRGIKPELPPLLPSGSGLPRYGLRWNGPTQPLAVRMDDGYWTPWHLADSALAAMRGTR
jgi:hypothetical protein